MSNETRKLPTRPGWWWADMSEWHGVEGVPPEPVEIWWNNGVASFDGMDDDEPIEDQITLIAPIPGPAVLAALAEYGVALATAEGSSESPILPRLGGPWDLLGDARRALEDAIRAERDGGA